MIYHGMNWVILGLDRRQGLFDSNQQLSELFSTSLPERAANISKLISYKCTVTGCGKVFARYFLNDGSNLFVCFFRNVKINRLFNVITHLDMEFRLDRAVHVRWRNLEIHSLYTAHHYHELFVHYVQCDVLLVDWHLVLIWMIFELNGKNIWPKNLLKIFDSFVENFEMRIRKAKNVIKWRIYRIYFHVRPKWKHSTSVSNSKEILRIPMKTIFPCVIRNYRKIRVNSTHNLLIIIRVFWRNDRMNRMKVLMKVIGQKSTRERKGISCDFLQVHHPNERWSVDRI